MGRLRELVARIRGAATGRRQDAALDDELQSHLEMLADEYVRNFIDQEVIPGIEYEYAACQQFLPEITLDQVNALAAKFGGDADRVVLVDEHGSVLDGDDILLAWARHLRDSDRLPTGRVVATVMSNFGLERTLADEKMELVRCAVGDRSVWLAMIEHGSVLGGEQSGHIICSHYGVTGDGLLTGSHLLAVAVRQGVPLSALSNLHRLPQVLLNVPVARMRPFDDVPTVSRQLAETHRRLEDRGRVLLRYSGTEPLARVMIEGEDAAEIAELAGRLAEVIRRELG